MRSARETFSNYHNPQYDTVLSSDGDVLPAADFRDADGEYIDLPETERNVQDVELPTKEGNEAYIQFEAKLDRLADQLGSYELARLRIGPAPEGYDDTQESVVDQRVINQAGARAIREANYERELQSILALSVSDEEKKRRTDELNARRRRSDEQRGHRS